jgi:hypothetical protein
MRLMFIFLIFGSVFAKGQEDLPRLRFMLGIDPGGLAIRMKDHDNNTRDYLYAVEAFPLAGIYLSNRWLVGVKGGREWVLHTNMYYEGERKMAGGFVRFFPSWLEFPRRGIDGAEFRLFHEFGVYRTNYFQGAEMGPIPQYVTGLSETQLQFHSGINWRVLGGLTLDLSLQFNHFVGQGRYLRPSLGFDVEYHFFNR